MHEPADDAHALPAEPLRRPRRATVRPAADPRRSLIIWLATAGALVLLFVLTVVALNSTVYSASGFVDRYLVALERRDATTLLELPGVTIPEGSDPAALTYSALRAVEDAEITREQSTGDLVEVEVTWSEGDTTGSTTLVLQRAASILGLFSDWSFAETPVEAVEISVLHSQDYRLNGTELVATAPETGVAATSRVAAFVPSRLGLDHESRYLESASQMVVASGETAAVTVDVRAGKQFVETVQNELDEFLETCAEQKVLLPAGCPFGTFVEDRLVAPPQWSIVEFPAITIEPADTFGLWAVPPTPGVAHVSAEVISLFDGSRSPLEEDTPFDVTYRIEIDADGALRLLGNDAA